MAKKYTPAEAEALRAKMPRKPRAFHYVPPVPKAAAKPEDSRPVTFKMLTQYGEILAKTVSKAIKQAIANESKAIDEKLKRADAALEAAETATRKWESSSTAIDIRDFASNVSDFKSELRLMRTALRDAGLVK